MMMRLDDFLMPFIIIISSTGFRLQKKNHCETTFSCLPWHLQFMLLKYRPYNLGVFSIPDDRDWPPGSNLFQGDAFPQELQDDCIHKQRFLEWRDQFFLAEGPCRQSSLRKIFIIAFVFFQDVVVFHLYQFVSIQSRVNV